MSTPAHDLHVLSGAYALDALDPQERAAFEAHLRECPDCREELRGLSATAARLGASARVEAPPELRERVMAEVRRSDRPAPVGARRPGEERRRSTGALLAAAAGVLAAATLGGVAWQQDRQADRAQARVAQIGQVLTAADAVTRRVPVEGGGSATAVVSAAESAAVFVASRLPGLDEDRVYQLWVVEGGEARPQPVLDVEGGTSVPVLARDVAGADALAVTVEPAGGSEQPTSEPLLVLPLA